MLCAKKEAEYPPLTTPDPCSCPSLDENGKCPICGRVYDDGDES